MSASASELEGQKGAYLNAITEAVRRLRTAKPVAADYAMEVLSGFLTAGDLWPLYRRAIMTFADMAGVTIALTINREAA